ncbi:MAG: ankyrin repeat domain-containing protein [Verrucomicrobiota bacterium]
MPYTEDTPFYQLLATKYDAGREAEAIGILDRHPDLARLEWPGPDLKGQPFVKGSTALHYAANDGKLRLIGRLIDCGADVNASNACWFRSVLSWAANNARLEAIRLLLAHGARPDSLDALHAAAWGGPACGKGREREYADALRLLIKAGADVNDRRHGNHRTPLGVALESGNAGAIEFLRSLGAAEV